MAAACSSGDSSASVGINSMNFETCCDFASPFSMT